MRYKARTMHIHRAFRALSLPVVAGLMLVPVVARAAGGAPADAGPLLGALAVVLIGALLGGALVERFGQAAVLGELAVGMVLGNLGLVGIHALDGLRGDPALDVLAQLGVLVLLFGVGLQSDVGAMRRVGASSALVAILGVVAPMALGWWAARLVFPAQHPLVHVFVGAAACATSVGITARVLADLGRAASVEGRIILGAAVIDDVLGLVVLAVVVGLLQAADGGAPFTALTALGIVARAFVFLAAALALGRGLSRVVFRLGGRLRGEGVLLTLALGFCFAFSWLASRVGLAPIVGAFSAGLVLEDAHYTELRERDTSRRDVRELLQPLAGFLVPVFFVLMGLKVDLRVFADPTVLGFAALLTVAAIVGKQVCALGVLERGVDRITVGLGMIPRGEVGLIVAGIGSTLHLGGQRVVDDAVYSAVVIMVMVTTLIAPPLMVLRLRR
jgi:Kef-type K+ transport system membrane component KefB